MIILPKNTTVNNKCIERVNMLYLGIDPGTRNMGLVLLEDGKIVHARMLHDTIHSVAKDNVNLRVVFRKRIKNLFKKMGKGSALIVEQFAPRGFGTNLSQLISLMIGNMQAIAEFYGIQENLVMSTHWKPAFKKKHDLDKLYDDGRKLGAPPHIIDSLLLATYLYQNKSFDKFSITNYKRNIKLAVNMLPEEDRIKPKRRKLKKK
jgi:Holliday junction resolvasome RuvABC endonuclease subunit